MLRRSVPRCFGAGAAMGGMSSLGMEPGGSPGMGDVPPGPESARTGGSTGAGPGMAGPSTRDGKRATPDWRAGEYVEQPEFYSNFFADKKPPLTKKAPLKTYEEYDQLSLEELQKLNEKRTEQIAELKMLHERSHRNVEYFYRKQALEYDEKALNFGEAAGSLNMDQISWHRRRLGDLRQKDWTLGRDKGIVLWACGIITFVWLVWLMTHYPYKRTIDHKGTLGSSWRNWGNVLSTDSRWLAKNVLTAYEAEKLQERMGGNAVLTQTRPEVMAPGSGYYVKLLNHEVKHETKL